MHLVTADVDEGPILAQEAVPVLDGDTEATLHERIKAVERTLYPDVIERLAASMRTTIKRALVSVYDKSELPEFARGLHELGVELVSSASTAAALEAAGLPVTRVEDVTGMPEMLDERVKTLHPNIHGGLLADRGKDSHLADLEKYGIEPFDLVVSNLYPFLERPGIDTIDIGGPAMVRAAAKNHAWLTVVTSTAQYDPLLDELRANDGTVSEETRRALALEAFAHTAAYDSAIVQWLQEGELLPQHLMLALERSDETLRYGENPHQQAARYRRRGATSWWDSVQQHGGLALSYLNFYDTDAAWKVVHDLGDGPACAIIKHANPCGVARRPEPRRRVPTRARVRRAFRLRWHRRAEPSDRRGHRRTHGGRSAGGCRDRARLRSRARSRRCSRSARTPASSKPVRPGRKASISGSCPAGSSCRNRTASRRAATTGGS